MDRLARTSAPAAQSPTIRIIKTAGPGTPQTRSWNADGAPARQGRIANPDERGTRLVHHFLVTIRAAAPRTRRRPRDRAEPVLSSLYSTVDPAGLLPTRPGGPWRDLNWQPPL